MKKFPALFTNTKTFNNPLPSSNPIPPKPTFNWKPILSNLLRNNEFEKAHKIFSQISSPNAHLYTMMINAHSRAGHIGPAFDLFHRMPKRDTAAWNSMIKACFDCGELNTACKLFNEMPDRNVISWTTTVNGLMVFGRIDDAAALFDRMPWRDAAAWNSMISGYCDNGMVWDAFKMFERMPRPNVISWTAMIGGFDLNGESDKALDLFRRMWVSEIKPTTSTLASVLTACAKALEFGLGRQLHAYVVKIGCIIDMYVSTALVTFYAQCKEVESSRNVFDENGERNVVSWTALVTGYGANGRHEDALNEFRNMTSEEITPNQSTFTSALSSCSWLEALDKGRILHASTVKHGLDFDVFVGNSLICLYSKCGDINDALKVFNNIGSRNIVSWNTVIVGCAQNGYGLLSLRIFNDMMASLVEPDAITFVGVLTACSHCMLLEKGRHLFQLLEGNRNIDKKPEHYVCMVDILGRSGNLEEAKEFIRNMPMKPNATIWLALLGACRVHSNVEVARRASQEIIDLDPHNSGAYVLLSNIYASAGRWNDVSQIRVMMRHRGIVKIPGSSWMVLKESRHEFVCGDRSHPMADEIYRKLDWLGGKLTEYGYVCDKRFVLHDVDDEQKEAVLTFHSEKLAVAFGLLMTVEGSTIRIMKNLRICGDCHLFMKVTSKLVGREIVLRDSSRFHHFRDGFCSCGDYW